MAFREVAMWEILTVLERLTRRESKAVIARVTGHSRSTVRRYERTARELGWTPDGEAPTDALAAEVGRRLHPASDRDTGEIEARLLPQLEQIRQWLAPGPHEKRGLRLTKVHQLLVRHGVVVPYSSLHRFVVKHCGFGTRGRITVRMADVAPGELAEIDFGRLGLVHDPATNRRRTAWALLVVLAHSRHQYVHVTFSQTVPEVIQGLEDAWVFFGGVAHRVVLDNLRAAITKADRYDPIFQRTFAVMLVPRTMNAWHARALVPSREARAVRRRCRPGGGADNRGQDAHGSRTPAAPRHPREFAGLR